MTERYNTFLTWMGMFFFMFYLYCICPFYFLCTFWYTVLLFYYWTGVKCLFYLHVFVTDIPHFFTCLHQEWYVHPAPAWKGTHLSKCTVRMTLGYNKKHVISYVIFSIKASWTEIKLNLEWQGLSGPWSSFINVLWH